MTINISELEALRTKMTDGTWWLDETDLDAEDINGLCAEHNAIPALLALARAVEELEQAKDEFVHRRGTSLRLSECHAAYDAARAAVTL